MGSAPSRRPRSVHSGSEEPPGRVLRQWSRGEHPLRAARACLEALVDGDKVSESTRAEFLQVADIVRTAEQQFGPGGSAALPFPWGGEGADVPGAPVSLRDMLLQIYTDCDLGAADGNKAISANLARCPGDGSESRKPSVQRERVMSELQLPMLTEKLQQVGTLHFDTVAFSEAAAHPLLETFVYIQKHRRLVGQVQDLGQISSALDFQTRLLNFMERISQLYKASNPYHSATHAADVIATQDWFFRMPYLQSSTSPLDRFMSLLAGAVHDVGHPGTNNAFHSKAMSALAIRYNDKSVLENMHVSLSFEVLGGESDCNWFELLSTEFRPPDDEEAPAVNLQQYVRKGLVHMVLATDMAKHAKQVADLNFFVDAQDVAAAAADSHRDKHVALEQKLMTLASVLHASDISNPFKPRPIMLKWMQRLLLECWAQGDEEKRLGLPVSPLCDRSTEKDAIPKGQLGFISYVVMPLMKPMANILPEMSEALNVILENKAWWEDRDAEKATQEDIWKFID